MSLIIHIYGFTVLPLDFLQLQNLSIDKTLNFVEAEANLALFYMYFIWDFARQWAS